MCPYALMFAALGAEHMRQIMTCAKKHDHFIKKGGKK